LGTTILLTIDIGKGIDIGKREVRQIMRYETPVVTDFGSIAEHTFTRCDTASGGAGAPPKDWMTCEHDKFGECSCGSTGLTP
jgi:hypothetical protein